MNNRERVRAILHYESCDRVPVVSFGYWDETLDKWAAEGHIDPALAEGYHKHGDSSQADLALSRLFGFDFNWGCCVGGNAALMPTFTEKLIREDEDGSRVIVDPNGHIVRVKPGVVSIPAEIGTILTGREVWEAEYLPKLQDSAARVNDELFRRLKAEDAARTEPLGLHIGSLYGKIRDWLGVEHLCYLAADDEELYEEIIATLAELCLAVAKRALSYGINFDFAHFWEDICFNNGPLINPRVFKELVGPRYKAIAQLVNEAGIDIVSLDCDGCIDKLVPIWLENGVNTMFPIEVGTWHASIDKWRKLYGRDLRGVGGMDKRVFAKDRSAVDQEIERLKPLVDLGGYIPCPDHRIAPDAKFELVQYYCEQFRKAF